ncbi:MAG: hypothetical protein JEY79_11025 [Pseudodesulfovibrio sp.]|nr:hypothetical protein [Pseudodesulfovibrio sp.]
MMLFERIEKIVQKKFGGSRSRLANALGEKQNTFNAYFSEERQDKFKAIHLERIFDLFPDINPVWLLTGEGEMIGETTAIVLPTASSRIKPSTMELERSPLLTQLATIEAAMDSADDLSKIEAMIAALKGQHQMLFKKRGGYGNKLEARESHLHETSAPYPGDACGINRTSGQRSDRLKD